MFTRSASSNQARKHLKKKKTLVKIPSKTVKKKKKSREFTGFVGKR